jgi:hypothetical protein
MDGFLCFFVLAIVLVLSVIQNQYPNKYISISNLLGVLGILLIPIKPIFNIPIPIIGDKSIPPKKTQEINGVIQYPQYSIISCQYF